jgi:hypothetical protein
MQRGQSLARAPRPPSLSRGMLQGARPILPPGRAAPPAAAAAAATAAKPNEKLPANELAALIASLKRSVRNPGAPGSLPAGAVVDAMVALENQRLPADGWRAAASAPGARWRLVYTAAEKVATAAGKRQPHGPATAFPLTACQKFDEVTGVFTNGVFVGGGLASLTFSGPYDVAGRVLSFDVTAVGGNLGPWRFGFPLKKGAPATLAGYDAAARKKLPFFAYGFADDGMVVARGRSGGLAVWVRADEAWLAATGVTRIYG